MGYLVCEKCGGYYELQPGESPENFEECECGGKLKYRKTIVVPENSSENLLGKSNDTRRNNKSKTPNNYYLQILGILIGVIIIFVFVVGFQKDMFTRFLLGFIGGFITSFIAGGKIKNGAINGSITGILGGVLSAIYIGQFGEYIGQFGGATIPNISAWIIGFTVPILIFSLIGGVIGVLCRKVVLGNRA